MRENFRNPFALSDTWKILAAGTVLALLIFLVFFYDPAPAYYGTDGEPNRRERIATPVLDHALLAQAKDATREHRLLIEAAPLAHLLEQSLDVVPTVARALGMPEEPVPLADLRASPDVYRGRYLWYKGRLRYLSRGKSGHPNPDYRIHEGWIETDEGQDVVFRVSLEPRDMEIGDYVRIQGFFLKLHDSHDLPETERAPVLVGPELLGDFPPWTEVTLLDHTILDEVDDTFEVDGKMRDDGGAWDTLPQSQYLPLWHLASFAKTQTDAMDFAAWRSVKPFVTKEQFLSVKDGSLERGAKFRILGEFIQSRTWEARPNPLGIEFWTEALVRVRDLGGKLVPVWVPRAIETERGEPLEVRAFYFRRFMYESLRGEVVLTPVFVADRISRFAAPPQGIVTQVVKWGFLAVIVGVIAMLFVLARRDRTHQVEHRRAMDERRKRRAQRTAVAAE